jgi:hypothetical protein
LLEKSNSWLFAAGKSDTLANNINRRSSHAGNKNRQAVQTLGGWGDGQAGNQYRYIVFSKQFLGAAFIFAIL